LNLVVESGFPTTPVGYDSQLVSGFDVGSMIGCFPHPRPSGRDYVALIKFCFCFCLEVFGGNFGIIWYNVKTRIRILHQMS